MGLFSKKPKEPEYDAVDCERKKNVSSIKKAQKILENC